MNTRNWFSMETVFFKSPITGHFRLVYLLLREGFTEEGGRGRRDCGGEGCRGGGENLSAGVHHN